METFSDAAIVRDAAWLQWFGGVSAHLLRQITNGRDSKTYDHKLMANPHNGRLPHCHLIVINRLQSEVIAQVGWAARAWLFPNAHVGRNVCVASWQLP